MGDNEVTQAVKALGGALHAAAVAGVVVETVYRACRAGYVANAKAAIRMARAMHPDDPAAALALAARLAGLPD